MLQKDKIRVYVAIILILIIATSYYLSRSKDIAGYVSLACMAIWLGMIYFLRKDH